jgi:hypothetical protein
MMGKKRNLCIRVDENEARTDDESESVDVDTHSRGINPALSSEYLIKADGRSGNLGSKPVALSGQACLQFDKTECMPKEVMFDIRRLDGRIASQQQSVLSSDSNFVATLVSMLP